MLHDLLLVAIRNVGRNKRRSMITIFTVFIGVVVAVSTRGLLNGLQGEIRANLTRKMHGDLQVHKRGYQDSLESQPFKLLLPYDDAAIAQYAAAKDADGKTILSAMSPRLRVMGLLNHQRTQTTTPVMITALDAAKELIVCPRLADAVQQGSMIDPAKEKFSANVPENVDKLGEAPTLDGSGSATPITAAPAGDFHQIMVTPSLMRGLGAALGDEIVVLFQDESNMQQALVAHIVAVVDPGIPGMSARMAWMDYATIARILGVTARASEIAFATAPGIDAIAAQASLARAAGEGKVVETWQELGGLLRDAMALQNVIFTAVLAILFTIVIAAIVNTSLMTVMERTREIGTLMAFGYRRRHIVFLFLTEAAVIGGLGGVIGVVFATLGVALLDWHGVAVHLPGQDIATVLRPNVTPVFIVFVLLLSITAALISGLMPAYRASRMKPVQALSSN